jgi:hypothetical protein
MRYLLAALVAAVTLGGCAVYPSVDRDNGQRGYHDNATHENMRGDVDNDHGDRGQY